MWSDFNIHYYVHVTMSLPIISEIAEDWFLSEPLLFSVYCSHQMVDNEKLPIVMRTGRGRVEYNAQIINKMPKADVERALRVEMLRILLKHPYQRQPFGATPFILAIASNLAIANNDSKLAAAVEIPPYCRSFAPNLTFEEYYHLLLGKEDDITSSFTRDSTDSADDNGVNNNDNNKVNDSVNNNENDNGGDNAENGDNEGDDNVNNKENNKGDDNGGDDAESGDNEGDSSGEQSGGAQSKIESVAELWEEDSMFEDNINAIIEKAESGGWGTVNGRFKELIRATLVPRKNLHRLLSHFRTTILSERRYLTRMRPSRRYDFDQMGSRYRYTTRLLVAVDVSGSVSSEDLQRFLGQINRLFQQGIEHIDVLQFDHDIKMPLIPMRKASNSLKIIGRGGTLFQPPIDYYMSHNEYDGLIMMTDGWAPKPVISNSKRPILWAIIRQHDIDIRREL